MKTKIKSAKEGDFCTKKLKSKHFSDPKILAFLLEHVLITHSFSKNASFFGFRNSPELPNKCVFYYGVFFIATLVRVRVRVRVRSH